MPNKCCMFQSSLGRQRYKAFSLMPLWGKLSSQECLLLHSVRALALKLYPNEYFKPTR
ncbi:hypothetical protein Q787_01480 [Ornithobacterium rhinotracheale H06-030791]|nr:hypothetical protein Q785_01510 [Ornithobacterium rhinotracheale ORT-UMN 88]KGB67838.1 hypothetical protein Q787_01480 [Ornithobacterium rhinotracheale H06-030791]